MGHITTKRCRFCGCLLLLLLLVLFHVTALTVSAAETELPDEIIVRYDPDDIDYFEPRRRHIVLAPVAGILMYTRPRPDQKEGPQGRWIYFQNTRWYRGPSTGKVWEGYVGWYTENLRIGDLFPLGGKIFALEDPTDKNVVRIRRQESPELEKRLGTKQSIVSGFGVTVGLDSFGFINQVPAPNVGPPWDFSIGSVYPEEDRPRRTFKISVGDEFVIPKRTFQPKENGPRYKPHTVPERRFRLTDVVPRDPENHISGWMVIDVIQDGEPEPFDPLCPTLQTEH